jgi:hypothetical protein
MSIFGGIAGDAITAAIKPIAQGLDELFTSDDERLTHDETLARIKQSPYLASLQVSLQALKHRTVFVAGGRPYLLWVCGTAIAYNYILRDIMAWGIKVWYPLMIPPPALEMGVMLTVLGTVLGVGGMRSYDKAKGTSA